MFARDHVGGWSISYTIRPMVKESRRTHRVSFDPPWTTIEYIRKYSIGTMWQMCSLAGCTFQGSSIDPAFVEQLQQIPQLPLVLGTVPRIRRSLPIPARGVERLCSRATDRSNMTELEQRPDRQCCRSSSGAQVDGRRAMPPSALSPRSHLPRRAARVLSTWLIAVTVGLRSDRRAGRRNPVVIRRTHSFDPIFGTPSRLISSSLSIDAR